MTTEISKEFALSHMLKVFDDVFAQRSLNVTVNTGDITSAGTNLHNIRIHISSDHPLVPMAKGLNLHELAHVLFSPSYENISAKSAMNMTANILEDQRIEWILSNQYPACRKYFTMLVKELKVKDPILLWGRRFMLPFTVKQPYPDIPRVADIIDEYIVSDNNLERKRLVIELYDLLEKEGKPKPRSKIKDDMDEIPGNTEGKRDKKASKDFGKEKSREEKENKAKQAREEAKQMGKQANQQKKAGLDKEAEQSKRKEERLEDSANKLADEASKMERSKAGADAENKTLSDDINEATEDATNKLNQAIADLESGKLLDNPGNITSSLEIASKIKTESVFPRVPSSLINDLTNILMTIRMELSSEYINKQKTGRLNTRDLIGPIDKLTVFKKFSPGAEDEALMSLILYIDDSGSMNTTDKNFVAQSSAFALSESVRQVGGESVVIGFSSYQSIWKLPNEVGMRNLAVHNGGTSIKYAINIGMALSKSLIYKILQIIVTDGQIDDVDALRKARALSPFLYTILVGKAISLGSVYMNLLREYSTVYSVNNINDLPRVLGSIVEQVAIEVLEKQER